MNPKASATGRALNRRWEIGAKHALYRKDGTWYHPLEAFPGALIDANGYVLFRTKKEYLTRRGLHIGTHVTIPEGISGLRGYIRKRRPRNTRTVKPIRYTRLHDDGSVVNAVRTIERKFDLPKGSVLLVYLNGRRVRSDSTVGALIEYYLTL